MLDKIEQLHFRLILKSIFVPKKGRFALFEKQKERKIKYPEAYC